MTLTKSPETIMLSHYHFHRGSIVSIVIDFRKHATRKLDAITSREIEIETPYWGAKHYELAHTLAVAEMYGDYDGWVNKDYLNDEIVYKERFETWKMLERQAKAHGTIVTGIIKGERVAIEQDDFIYPDDKYKTLETKISHIRCALRTHHPCGNIIEECGRRGYRFTPASRCSIMNDHSGEYKTLPMLHP